MQATTDSYFDISVIDAISGKPVKFHLDTVGNIVLDETSEQPLALISQTQVAMLSVEEFNAIRTQDAAPAE